MAENPQQEPEADIDPRHTARLQHRLRLGAVLGILLTSILVGGLSSVLLYRAHTQFLSKELLFNMELVSAALQSELARLQNNVVQITSRTRIRQELEKYNRGELDREALNKFTHPKLQDVLRRAPDIKGISRLNLQGEVLVEVGEAIDPAHWPSHYQDDSPAQGPVFEVGSQPYLVISAPIRNRSGEKVGIDLAKFDVARLDGIVAGFLDRHEGSGRVQINALAGRQAQTYLAHGEQLSLAKEKLYEETAEVLSEGPDEGLHKDNEEGLLIVRSRIAGTPWGFLFLSESDAFFAPARNQAIFVMFAFLGLTLVGIFITHLVIHPVAGRILVGTQTLYELLGRNRKLLTRARESEAQLQAIIDNAPAVIYAKNLDGSYRLINSAYEKATGLSREQVTGHTDHELFSPQLADRYRENDQRVLELDHAVESDEKAQHADGLHDYLSIRFPLKDDTQQTFGTCGISTDITDRKRREHELRRLAAVFANTGEAIIMTDGDGTIIDVNPAFTRIMGYRREEAIGNKPNILKSGRHDPHFYELMWQALHSKGAWRGEIWNQRKGGNPIPTLLSITRIDDENAQAANYVAVYSDISAIKQSEERLGHLAHHDALTDLPNRVLLDIHMEQAIARARRSNRQLGVIFLDLDHFKNVNDSLGHKAGDELLVEVSKLLRGAIRSADTVARISGDEFVMLMEDVQTPEAIIQVVEKILHAMDRPFLVSGQSIRVTASLGVSLFPDDGENGSMLMRNADAAMYLAKSEGRNTYNFYTEELTRQAFERMQMESWLREALENDEFTLHYQPQMDLRDGSLRGLEALLRWTRTDGTVIPPDRFIPIAEDSDLIHPLGRWILHHACRQASQWLDQDLDFGNIAINISGKQVSAGNLVQLLDEVLDETGLPPQHLELELTESFVMGEPRGTVATLAQLRERGITLTVDDFGTGYSSLGYLKSLPIQRLKIDRSFIRDIPEDSNDMAITRAVIGLGDSLQLEIVGEGIETRTQLDFLRNEGCHLGQGYLYSRPLPAEQLLPLLHDHGKISAS